MSHVARVSLAQVHLSVPGAGAGGPITCDLFEIHFCEVLSFRQKHSIQCFRFPQFFRDSASIQISLRASYCIPVWNRDYFQ